MKRIHNSENEPNFKKLKKEETIKETVIRYINEITKNFELKIDITHILSHLDKDVPNDSKMTLNDLLEYIASYISNFISDNYHFDQLASNLILKKLYKITANTYSEVLEDLYKNKLVNEHYYKYAKDNIDLIEQERITGAKNETVMTYFGVKTLVRAYLLKREKRIIERIQDLYLRVALTVQANDIGEAIKTYRILSQGFYTHATPTMFNSGTKRQQLASCFLVGTEDDLNELFETVRKMALISKWSGGIGVHLSNVRAKGSLINSTNGESSGIIPFIMLINAESRYVDQGGKRKGAFAIYLEPWHADFAEFLKLRLNTGDPNERAKDIFTAVWMCDLFMNRVKNNEMWSMMCPAQCPGLTDVYGDEFEKLYTQYEKEGRYMRQVKARDLWFDMMTSQIETGTPYVLHKDSINKKSNQKNIGTIKSSNLCAEIVEVSNSKLYAVCNLASIALPKFVEKDGSFNYNKLYDIARVATKNLNATIDLNYYPVPETELSNKTARPIGLGVQGLNDVFWRSKCPYDSQKALELNAAIFETIYYAAMRESCDLAKQYGPYDYFKGSPASEGKLQFHLWGIDEKSLSGRWDWKTLIADIMKYGLRNSLTTCIMPTASTSQILGNTESTEPQSSNLYTRETQAGSFTIINRYLMDDLMKLNLWNKDMKDKIIFFGGSIQKIIEIPEELRNLYKTVWEIHPKFVIDHAVGRGPFEDQTQSMNLYIAVPNTKLLTWALFYGWAKGLKTGMYYLRSLPASEAIKFNLDATKIKELQEQEKLQEQKNKMTINPFIVNSELYPEERVCARRKKGESTEGCNECSA